MPKRTSRNARPCLGMHEGNAVAISLAQAAEATGRDRSTILRGIKRGTISAVRDQRTRAWMVEPAELFRTFPPMHEPQPAQAAHNGADSVHTRLAVAEAELRLKDEIIAELRRTNALLMDQRTAARRSWWPWRRG